MAAAAEQQRHFQEAMNIINAKIPVENMTGKACVAYLSHHNLICRGNKSSLVNRIRQHVNLLNDPLKQTIIDPPPSAFSVPCNEDDLCEDDLIMFEEKVPGGSRMVAATVISASAQSRNFKVEVIWSTGTDKLQPLTSINLTRLRIQQLKLFRKKCPEREKQRKQLLKQRLELQRIKSAAKPARVPAVYRSRGSQNASTSDKCSSGAPPSDVGETSGKEIVTSQVAIQRSNDENVTGAPAVYDFGSYARNCKPDKEKRKKIMKEKTSETNLDEDSEPESSARDDARDDSTRGKENVNVKVHENGDQSKIEKRRAKAIENSTSVLAENRESNVDRQGEGTSMNPVLALEKDCQDDNPGRTKRRREIDHDHGRERETEHKTAESVLEARETNVDTDEHATIIMKQDSHGSRRTKRKREKDLDHGREERKEHKAGSNKHSGNFESVLAGSDERDPEAGSDKRDRSDKRDPALALEKDVHDGSRERTKRKREEQKRKNQESSKHLQNLESVRVARETNDPASEKDFHYERTKRKVGKLQEYGREEREEHKAGSSKHLQKFKSVCETREASGDSEEHGRNIEPALENDSHRRERTKATRERDEKHARKHKSKHALGAKETNVDIEERGTKPARMKDWHDDSRERKREDQEHGREKRTKRSPALEREREKGTPRLATAADENTGPKKQRTFNNSRNTKSTGPRTPAINFKQKFNPQYHLQCRVCVLRAASRRCIRKRCRFCCMGDTKCIAHYHRTLKLLFERR